jgi:ABC-type transport system involved in cytochrome bd biosynthesis fused ATPase/permease subunit
MVLVSKYNGKMEATIRDNMKLAISAALQEALQRPLHVKVLESNIMHTELQPEGDQFSLRFTVSVHPKKAEERADDPG